MKLRWNTPAELHFYCFVPKPHKNYFKGKKVLVFGLGLLGGGVATTNWLIKHGARVTVTDLKDEKYLEPSLKRLKGKSKLRLNGHDKKDIEDNEVIVFNPDVSVNNPFVRYALKISRQVENEATIFYKLCPRPIIAVTGTRGKTTTANWVGHFLNPVRSLARAKSASPEDLGEATSNGVNALYKAVVTGNSYAEPLLKTLDSLNLFSYRIFTSSQELGLKFWVGMKQFIPTAQEFENRLMSENWVYAVNEIPSYHLEFFDSAIPVPAIAVITNLYQDHLNRHKTMKNYALAKAAVFRNQAANQHLVLNYDNEWTPFFF